MNKISTFYNHVMVAAERNGWDMDAALEKVKSYGIDLIEMQDKPELSMEEIKKLFDRHEMGVSCVCAHFDFLRESEEESRAKYQHAFWVAKLFGCSKVLCVPGSTDKDRGYEEQMEVFVKKITQMCHEAEKEGITVMVEPFDSLNSPCCKAADLLYLFEHVPGLKFAFDTGNFRYACEDLEKAYESFAKYTVHVHCKDRGETAPAGETDPSYILDAEGKPIYTVAVGEGDLNLDKWIRRFVADGYQGALVAEHFGAKDQAATIQKSAENIRRVLETVQADTGSLE